MANSTLTRLLDSWKRPAGEAPAVAETLPLRIATMLLLQRVRQDDQPVTDDHAVAGRNALARQLAGHAPIFGRRRWIAALERIPAEVLDIAKYNDGGTTLTALDENWSDLRLLYADFRAAAEKILRAC